MSANQAPKPRRLTPSERLELEELQKLFKPELGLKRLEDYGKWLFLTIAAVGSLGAAFSNEAFKDLSDDGKALFGIAIGVLGFSLAAATLSLAPKWVTTNPNSRSDLKRAVNEIYKHRRELLEFAGTGFALSLALAGLSPLLSTESERETSITYEITETDTLKATFSTQGLEPSTSVGLTVQGTPPEDRTLPRECGMTNAEGATAVSVEITHVNEFEGSLVLIGRLDCGSGEDNAERTVTVER
jgi:hypothetical protein